MFIDEAETFLKLYLRRNTPLQDTAIVLTYKQTLKSSAN